KDAAVISKKCGGAVPPPAHLEVKDDGAAGAAVLKFVSLMVAAFCFGALHAHGRFIRLDVTACEQVGLQGFHHGHKQATRCDNRSVERAAGEGDSKVPIQISLLPVNGQMRAVFLDDDIDDERI